MRGYVEQDRTWHADREAGIGDCARALWLGAQLGCDCQATVGQSPRGRGRYAQSWGKVNRLIVADIAPVAYGHSQLQYIKAMQAVDLTRVERRSDAAAQLQATVDNPALVPFFLQALDVTEKRWLLNLDTLALEMPKILSFPDISGVYEGKVMFLTGAESSYVTREHRDRIKALFPAAQFAKLPGAGHWLHAEKPREFEAAVRTWLG